MEKSLLSSDPCGRLRQRKKMQYVIRQTGQNPWSVPRWVFFAIAVFLVCFAKDASVSTALADDLETEKAAAQRLQVQYGLSLSQIRDLLTIGVGVDREPRLARWSDESISVAILISDGTDPRIIERLTGRLQGLSVLAGLGSQVCVEIVKKTGSQVLGKEKCLAQRQDMVVAVESATSEPGSVIDAVQRLLPEQTKKTKAFWKDATDLATIRKDATNCGTHIDIDETTSVFLRGFAFLHIGTPNDPSSYRLADCASNLPYLMLGSLPMRNGEHEVFSPELLKLLYSPRLRTGMPRSVVGTELGE